jgi:hypothetical protein
MDLQPRDRHHAGTAVPGGGVKPAWCLIPLLASCELVEAAQNVKEVSRTLQASIGRLDQMTTDAKEAWDQWVMPAVIVVGFAAVTFFQRKRHNPPP